MYDLANSVFQFGGALIAVLNVRAILRDHELRGVSIVAPFFFTSWGLFNLFYYVHLEQWFSLATSVLLFGANAAWMSLIVLYRLQSTRLRFGISGIERFDRAWTDRVTPEELGKPKD